MGASTKLSTPFLQIAVCGLERLGSKQLFAVARDSAINEALMFSVKNEIFILPLRRKNSTVQAKRVLDFSDA